MKKSSKGITLLGLGPGNPELVTHEAWSILNSISEIFLLTVHHPIVQELPEGLHIHNFDEMFKHERDYASVFEHIVKTVMELGRCCLRYSWTPPPIGSDRP